MTRGSLARIGIVAAVAVAIAVDSARNDETISEVSDASDRPSSHVAAPSPIGTVAKPGMDAVTAAKRSRLFSKISKIDLMRSV